MAYSSRQNRRRISAEKERFRYNIIESISNKLATNFSENPCKIKLFHFFSIKLGYVPREDNKIAARLMDAGKILFGRILMKEKKGSWIKIYVKVFLRE